jgi:hypothetical protein
MIEVNGHRERAAYLADRQAVSVSPGHPEFPDGALVVRGDDPESIQLAQAHALLYVGDMLAGLLEVILRAEEEVRAEDAQAREPKPPPADKSWLTPAGD